MRFLFFLIFGIMFKVSTASAFSDQQMTVAGIIKSFDAKSVQVVVGDKIYEVPRKLIMLSNIKSGQKIEFETSQDDFKKLKSSAVPKK